MEPIHASMLVDAPRRIVWDALSEMKAVATWNPAIDGVECLSDERRGLGARRRCFMHPSGWMTETVTEWQEGRVISFTVEDAPPLEFGVGRFRLFDLGPGTLVEGGFTYRVKFGPLGPVMDRSIVHRQLSAAWNQGIEGLRSYAKHKSETAVGDLGGKDGK